MGIELEWKFRATPQVQATIRQALEGQEETYQMETTYYDTPSGALQSRRFTLRRRMENQRSVCTLKTPAGGAGRREFELECSRIEEAMPQLFQMAGLSAPALLGQEAVQPLCYARFTRIAKTLTLPECTLELALDQGILGGGSRELPLCEIEVELKSGSAARAEAFALQLAVAYGLTPEPESKFSRSLALQKEE